MKYVSPLIMRAMQIAYDAHHGQTDACGLPYIFHPAFLASQMDTADEICTALLHDVVEDSSITFADLEDAGFPQTVLDALKLLTHDDGSVYTEYIFRIKQNPLATKVKLADLRHNSNRTRNTTLSLERTSKLQERYKRAIILLEK